MGQLYQIVLVVPICWSIGTHSLMPNNIKYNVEAQRVAYFSA